MKITVIGGGPGGLYFSILTKKRMSSDCIIDVYEQNGPDEAFGFGVVFSDETLSEFLSYDPKSYELIRNSFSYWDDIDIARDNEKVTIKGNGFCGCSRKILLQLLQQRCREEGINLHFNHKIDSLDTFADSDIILAADGLNSLVRSQYVKEFGTKITMKSNHFVWCGSSKPLDAFTYFFRNTQFGVFCAHTYQYEAGKSTWIFECTDETFKNAGFKELDEEGTVKALEELFKEELDGHKLITNRSHWRQFPHVTNETWSHKNIVLLGDAKATAHYSIGSGTKLAMECAIALSDSVVEHPDNVQKAFDLYEEKRKVPVAITQHAALVSLSWFEAMDRHILQEFNAFSFSVMSRSKKITIENQARRDKDYAQRIIKSFNKNIGNPEELTPPAFTPFSINNLELENRIVMSPMGQYSAENGLVSDWHVVHYGSRAIGGVGLIIAEMTAISEKARITPGCAGLWNDEQVKAWRKVTSFVHQNSNAKIGVQIGHAGRKGSCNIPEKGSKPLENGGWDLVSASAIPYSTEFSVPKEITEQEMDEIVTQFVDASLRAKNACFDLIEIQLHHGFLLASFLSPLTNARKDGFGGRIENRSKFPLRVVEAVRKSLGEDFPLSVRISATDWHDEGISDQDVIYFSKQLKSLGADVINVSTGNTVKDQKPVTGRMWQSNYSEVIKTLVEIPTITAGHIQDIDQINTLLLNKRTDLVAIGRPLLIDPSFVRRAQAYEQFKDTDLIEVGSNPQYSAGLSALYSAENKKREEYEKMKMALKPKPHKTLN